VYCVRVSVQMHGYGIGTLLVGMFGRKHSAPNDILSTQTHSVSQSQQAAGALLCLLLGIIVGQILSSFS